MTGHSQAESLSWLQNSMPATSSAACPDRAGRSRAVHTHSCAGRRSGRPNASVALSASGIRLASGDSPQPWPRSRPLRRLDCGLRRRMHERMACLLASRRSDHSSACRAGRRNEHPRLALTAGSKPFSANQRSRSSSGMRMASAEPDAPDERRATPRRVPCRVLGRACNARAAPACRPAAAPGGLCAGGASSASVRRRRAASGPSGPPRRAPRRPLPARTSVLRSIAVVSLPGRMARQLTPAQRVGGPLAARSHWNGPPRWRGQLCRGRSSASGDV